jgi:hypothetical protein
MKCFLCYSSPVVFCNYNIQTRFNLIQYNKHNNNIEKNVNANHSIIAKMFKEEVDRSLKGEVEKQPTKKKVKSIW